MMGMSLTYSLLHPEDAMRKQNSMEIQTVQALPALAPQIATMAINNKPSITTSQKDQNDHANSLFPSKNAVAPYQHQKGNNTPDFDLMSILTDVENEILDEELVLAATQCEAASFEQNKNVMPVTTTMTTMMRKITNPTPTFSNCSFGSIGTLDIHIHKN